MLGFKAALGVAVMVALTAPGSFAGAFGPADIRSFDGFGNNQNMPQWGSAGTPLRRVADHQYPDAAGDSIIVPPQRANPRDISNTIAVQQAAVVPNARGMSDMVWQWGQFLDHDIDLTEHDAVNGTANIPVAAPDPLAPGIPFSRSNYVALDWDGDSVPERQQINEISAFIDASNVYGSNPGWADHLREDLDPMQKGARLRTSPGNMLPIDPLSGFYEAGDMRVNEQVALTAMHTVFVREHNRLVSKLEVMLPGADEEDRYQWARKIVGAEMQVITYNEFLPALLGPDAPKAADYSYNDGQDPSVANAFSTALYRLGHSMLSPDLLLLDTDGSQAGTLPLRDAFFTPHFYTSQPDGGNERLAQVLRGLSMQRAQEIDNQVIDDVRNFLFGDPGMGGMDLPALNIQRGRDHGLPDYNTLREAYELPRVTDFNQITVDTVIQDLLRSLYGNVDNIDAWVGALAEDHRESSSLGELMTAAMVDQFVRLRDGDRFFYLGDPDLVGLDVAALFDMGGGGATMLSAFDSPSSFSLDDVTLSDIIRLNLPDIGFFPDDPFRVVPEPPLAALMLLGLAVLAMRRRRQVSARLL
jgi:hypothetical protein